MLKDLLLLHYSHGIEPPFRPLRGVGTAERGTRLADVCGLHGELNERARTRGNAGYRAIIRFHIIDDPVEIAIGIGRAPAVEGIYAA